MKALMNGVKKFFSDESGATMVEYALMLALIAIVALVAVILVGQATSTTFSKIGSALTEAGG